MEGRIILSSVTFVLGAFVLLSSSHTGDPKWQRDATAGQRHVISLPRRTFERHHADWQCEEEVGRFRHDRTLETLINDKATVVPSPFPQKKKFWPVALAAWFLTGFSYECYRAEVMTQLKKSHHDYKKTCCRICSDRH